MKCDLRHNAIVDNLFSHVHFQILLVLRFACLVSTAWMLDVYGIVTLGMCHVLTTTFRRSWASRTPPDFEKSVVRERLTPGRRGGWTASRRRRPNPACAAPWWTWIAQRSALVAAYWASWVDAFPTLWHCGPAFAHALACLLLHPLTGARRSCGHQHDPVVDHLAACP